MRAAPELQVERVGYALGARIGGIDLRELPDDATMARIRAAWLAHFVVFFPGQRLTPEQQRAFTAKLGIVDDNSQSQLRHPDHPEIIVLENKPGSLDTFRVGERWHSDLSTTIFPTSASLLYCRALPAAGGDTVFANQYAAFGDLSQGMQAQLRRLEAIHDITIGAYSRRPPEIVARQRKLQPPVVQPSVRTHPETGREALYLCERVRRFKDMTVAESAPLLRHLTRSAVRDELVYRHRWNVGDLLIWDNRCLMHKALGDFDMRTQPRIMFRTSVRGHQSGYLFAGDSVEPAPE